MSFLFLRWDMLVPWRFSNLVGRFGEITLTCPWWAWSVANWTCSGLRWSMRSFMHSNKRIRDVYDVNDTVGNFDSKCFSTLQPSGSTLSWTSSWKGENIEENNWICNVHLVYLFFFCVCVHFVLKASLAYMYTYKNVGVMNPRSHLTHLIAFHNEESCCCRCPVHLKGRLATCRDHCGVTPIRRRDCKDGLVTQWQRQAAEDLAWLMGTDGMEISLYFWYPEVEWNVLE